MKTKTIFDQEGVQVWETDNKDARGKEWHLSYNGIGCSVGFKPEFDVEWIKQYLAEYLQLSRDGNEVNDAEAVPAD